MRGGVTVYDMERRKAALAEVLQLKEAIRAGLEAMRNGEQETAMDILRRAISEMN